MRERGRKRQFSLLSLLVFLTVTALVCAIGASFPRLARFLMLVAIPLFLMGFSLCVFLIPSWIERLCRDDRECRMPLRESPLQKKKGMKEAETRKSEKT